MDWTLYEVLGIAPDASRGQVRAAYRRAARLAHPDAGGSDTEFRRVATAYQVLGDPRRRAGYDRDLASPPRPGPAPPARPADPEPTVPPPNVAEIDRRQRIYLRVMAVSVSLFVLAGSVVRLLWVPAAVAMLVVAMLLLPFGGLLAASGRARR